MNIGSQFLRARRLEKRLAAAGSAAAVFALVAATVWRHEHAAFGAGWRTVEGRAGTGRRRVDFFGLG